MNYYTVKGMARISPSLVAAFPKALNTYKIHHGFLIHLRDPRQHIYRSIGSIETRKYGCILERDLVVF